MREDSRSLAEARRLAPKIIEVVAAFLAAEFEMLKSDFPELPTLRFTPIPTIVARIPPRLTPLQISESVLVYPLAEADLNCLTGYALTRAEINLWGKNGVAVVFGTSKERNDSVLNFDLADLDGPSPSVSRKTMSKESLDGLVRKLAKRHPALTG